MKRLIDERSSCPAVLGTLLAVLISGASGQVGAHGGVSIEDDICLLQLGAYRMHFTGYQPAQSGAQEFCEDIPSLGTAIIVLDAVDDELRDIPIELTLLRDVNKMGNNATFDDLGGAAAISAASVARLAAAAHPSGSLTLQYQFSQAGRYIGLVRAQPAVGDEVIALFPFAVGAGDRRWRFYVAVIIGTVLLAGVLFALATRLRRDPQPLGKSYE